MRTISLLSILGAFIITGCRKDNDPGGPVDSDAELRRIVVGTWAYSDMETVAFRSDGTFADSSFRSVQTDSVYHRQVYLATSGRYTISDSVLSKSDVHLDCVDSTFLA